MNATPAVKENAPALWRIPPLCGDDHKYTRGHALLFGGAVMTGAARLAALAAARSGAGLVTLAAPREAWPIYAESLLSIITRPLDSVADWENLLADKRISVVLIGPGAGSDGLPHAALKAALMSDKKLVLDADALTMLAKGMEQSDRELPSSPLAGERDALLCIRGGNRILTPHEGEYAKLAGALGLDASASKPARALALAKALGCTVVLKGAQTIVAHADGRVVANHADAPWLATGGTGDVLAGIITGLLAQGMDLFDAACAAVWLHSEAARSLGRGMLAEDLLGEIRAALRALYAMG